MSPTLNFHVQENGARGGTTNGGLEHEYEHDHDHDHDHDHHHHHHHHDAIPVHDHCMCKHDEGDSGDEEVEFDHPDYRYATTGPLAVNGKAPLDSVQRRLMEASRGGKQVGPGSVASSADGYESFENTSNKKKRKIPLSSASSMHQSSLSAEMASMGINNFDGTPDEYPHAQRPHHAGPGSSPSGTGISGAGRGRYGRQTIRDVRRPLANGTMNTINGYGPKAPARSVSGSEVRSVGESSHAAFPNFEKAGAFHHNLGKALTTACFIHRHLVRKHRRHHIASDQDRSRARTAHAAEGQRERQSSATICLSLRHSQDSIHLHLRIG